ncbi:MAG: hypothetical protein LJE94_16370 [Deltaproteobacteria bacterium]|nr:hypothetical protein [Deltaproteobacteria bacterium]
MILPVIQPSDPTFRIIDSKTIEENFLITHDYYDHRDADKDLNIVFPVTRVREMAAAKVIGSIAEHHYSFMGHITGPHHLFEFAFWTSFGRTIQ